MSNAITIDKEQINEKTRNCYTNADEFDLSKHDIEAKDNDLEVAKKFESKLAEIEKVVSSYVSLVKKDMLAVDSNVTIMENQDNEIAQQISREV